jgi:hypothetical protein
MAFWLSKENKQQEQPARVWSCSHAWIFTMLVVLSNAIGYR